MLEVFCKMDGSATATTHTYGGSAIVRYVVHRDITITLSGASVVYDTITDTPVKIIGRYDNPVSAQSACDSLNRMYNGWLDWSREYRRRVLV
jgi:hypothetical protein